MESACEEKGLNQDCYMQIATMSVRRSRRLAGLEPVFSPIKKPLSEENSLTVTGPSSPNIMQMISQYLFFLVCSTLLLRGVLLR